MAFGIETSNVTSFQMSGTSHSFAHTNTAGNLLILCVSWAASAGRTMNTPTYNGVSMTQLTNSPVAEPANGFLTAIWYLKAPATGSNTLAFTTNAAGTSGFAAAYCFTDADQTTTFGTSVTNSASTGSPTVNVSSAAGEIVIDSCCLNSRTFSSAGASQTAIFMQSGTATNPRLATSQEAGAASVTMSWNTSSSGNWSIIAVPVKPTASGGGFAHSWGYII